MKYHEIHQPSSGTPMQKIIHFGVPPWKTVGPSPGLGCYDTHPMCARDGAGPGAVNCSAIEVASFYSVPDQEGDFASEPGEGGVQC